MCILSQHSMDSLLLTGALMPEGGPITVCLCVRALVCVCFLIEVYCTLVLFQATKLGAYIYTKQLELHTEESKYSACMYIVLYHKRSHI